MIKVFWVASWHLEARCHGSWSTTATQSQPRHESAKMLDRRVQVKGKDEWIRERWSKNEKAFSYLIHNKIFWTDCQSSFADLEPSNPPCNYVRRADLACAAQHRERGVGGGECDLKEEDMLTAVCQSASCEFLRVQVSITHFQKHRYPTLPSPSRCRAIRHL